MKDFPFPLSNFLSTQVIFVQRGSAQQRNRPWNRHPWRDLAWQNHRMCMLFRVVNQSDTLPKFNMVHLKMAPWNRRFLLETIIFRFHVKLAGSNSVIFVKHHASPWPRSIHPRSPVGQEIVAVGGMFALTAMFVTPEAIPLGWESNYPPWNSCFRTWHTGVGRWVSLSKRCANH